METYDSWGTVVLSALDFIKALVISILSFLHSLVAM